MDRGVFKFILRYSKRQQILLLLMIALSYPFYYFSLDLPKTIVNEAIDGTDFPQNLTALGWDLGFELDQISYLLVLCFAFLSLVLINGGFKYFINVYRGVVGERMLRRLRYLLINRVIRFPLPHFRNISEGEIVSMVTAETEPLGGFVGESLSLPAFQGGMLITALIFMFVQDPILGIAAIALYPVQAWGIPKLQRKVNLLNKERVLNVRKLSERINEMVAGSAEIHAHDTSQFELADFSSRLGKIYQIRYKVYRKKFFIKFLNNFLAQVTPFFFFSIGGYLVIKGDLSLGALVAILAAYKDLAPPWKELLNFYQRMEDARIKYAQLIERFDPPGMYSEEVMAASPDSGAPLSGRFSATSLLLEEDEGTKTLENVNLAFDANNHVALLGSPGSGKADLAKLLARQLVPSSGSLTLDGTDLTTIPESVTGRQIGYVDQEAYIRSGTISDNLFYGLKHYPRAEATYSSEEASEWEKQRTESRESGNSEFDINADWLDRRAGDHGENGTDDILERGLRALRAVGLDGDVQTIGFRSTIDPTENPTFADGIMKARETLHNRIEEEEYAGLVETWERTAFNRNASVAENILFGTPVDDMFAIETLGQNEHIQNALKKVGLYDEFADMGWKVAALMVELFRDLPPGHEFFDRFSFISADDLPDFQIILTASGSGGVEALTSEQRERLRQLPFKLTPAKHRLGLIDAPMEERLLAARRAFAEDLPDSLRDKVSFFDLNTYNPASSILDNALFGKVDSSRSDSGEKIQHLVAEVFDDLSLNLSVLEAGLDSEVGIAGRRLNAVQRQKLAIARNLVKDPSLLIINEATGVFDPSTQTSVFSNVKEIMDGRGLIWVNGDVINPSDFDQVYQVEGGRVREAAATRSAETETPSVAQDSDDTAQNEVGLDTELLARIPFFAGLDRSRLKLLAFTSERQTLEAQEVLFKQGDSADEACVIVDGTFSIIAETAEGRVKVADAGRGGVIGELALLCEAPRTATVQANEQATVLKIAKDVFIQLIKDNPAVGANLSRILASKLEAMMRSMSAHYELYDPVTGLPNRNLFLDHLKSTAYVDQWNAQVSSVIFIDFPSLNDLEMFKDLERRQTLLREIATRIKPTIRAADTFARLEGFRFGVVARGFREDQASDLLLSRIIDSLGEPVTIGDHVIDLNEHTEARILGLDQERLEEITEQA